MNILIVSTLWYDDNTKIGRELHVGGADGSIDGNSNHNNNNNDNKADRTTLSSPNEYNHPLPSKKNKNTNGNDRVVGGEESFSISTFSSSISGEEKFSTPIKATLDKLSNIGNVGDAFSNDLDATGSAISSSSSSSSSTSSSAIPYYLKGKTTYKNQKFHRKKTFQRIQDEKAKPVDASQRVWVLPDPVKLPTRNHESILLEYNDDNNDRKGNDKQILVNVLGRHSRGVQWMDLETGEQRSMETNGTDPDQRPLNDLNHVASVVVDSFDPDDDNGNNNNKRKRKEVWLPCGFHNDRVGKELSSNYVRIVDLETMQVRTGPKLPFSGGACGAAPIEAIPGEPPLICAFGGTNGNHDTGE